MKKKSNKRKRIPKQIRSSKKCQLYKTYILIESIISSNMKITIKNVQLFYLRNSKKAIVALFK